MKKLSSLVVFHFVHIADILQEHFEKFVDEIYISLGGGEIKNKYKM